MVNDLILFCSKSNEEMNVKFKNGYAFITDTLSEIAVCSKADLHLDGAIQFSQLKKMKGCLSENFAMILNKNKIELKTDNFEQHFKNNEFEESPYFLKPEFAYSVSNDVMKFLKIACKFSNAEVCNHVICVDNFMACTDGGSVFIVKTPFKWDFRFSFPVEFAKKLVNVKDELLNISINTVGIQFNFTEFCASSSISHKFDYFNFDFLNEEFEKVDFKYNKKQLPLFLDLNSEGVLTFEEGFVKKGENIFKCEESNLECRLTSKDFKKMLPYFEEIEVSESFVKSETENYICGIVRCV